MTPPADEQQAMEHQAVLSRLWWLAEMAVAPPPAPYASIRKYLDSKPASAMTDAEIQAVYDKHGVKRPMRREKRKRGGGWKQVGEALG